MSTVVDGVLASALLEIPLPVRYFPSMIRSQKCEHDSQSRGMSRATTPLLGPGACDARAIAARDRQVVLRLLPKAVHDPPLPCTRCHMRPLAVRTSPKSDGGCVMRCIIMPSCPDQMDAIFNDKAQARSVPCCGKRHPRG